MKTKFKRFTTRKYWSRDQVLNSIVAADVDVLFIIQYSQGVRLISNESFNQNKLKVKC